MKGRTIVEWPEKYCNAYLVDGDNKRMGLIKIPVLIDNCGLPDVPRHVVLNKEQEKVPAEFAYLCDTNPLTYKWIETPLEAVVIKSFVF